MILQFLEMIREFLSSHIVFSIGALLIGGYVFGKLSEKIKLPSITGYIIAGLFVGGSGLDLIHADNSHLLHIVSELTLSFIALTIGGEFAFSKLRVLGKKIVILTLTQMFATFGLISGGLILLGIPGYVAFILGSIGAATAPAATVVIVEKLKARGVFVDYLYGIVALDDAGTVVLFAITFSLSAGIMSGKTIPISESIIHAATEIFYSVLIGLITGAILHHIVKKIRSINEVKIITLGLIFVATAIAINLRVSPLITNMTIGMILVNLSSRNVRLIHALEPLTPPLYAIFFAIAGTELHLEIFTNSELLIAGLSFIILRGIGKFFGIYYPAKLIKAPQTVQKYLGYALLPQAGVAIGLVLFVQASPIVEAITDPIVKDWIVKMVNIVLMAVFVNEILGPPLARYAVVSSMRKGNV